MVIQNYYSAAAVVLTRLDPSTLSLPRTAEDLLLAHLVFKCVVKIATWVWSRCKPSDQASMSKLEPWVNYLLILRFHRGAETAPQILQLFQNCAAQLQTICQLRISLIEALHSSSVPANAIVENSVATLTRHIRLFGKFFRRIQQLDVPRFISLPGCGELILFYWSKVVQATNGPAEYIEGQSDASTAVFKC